MDNVIKWLFNLWPWIIILGVIIGLVPPIVKKIKELLVGKPKYIVRSIMLIIYLVIAIISFAGFTYGAFTYVPDLYDHTVREAKSMLQEKGLIISYPFGEHSDDDTDNRKVIFQEYKANSLVLKGTHVLIGYDLASYSSAIETRATIVPNLVGEKYTEAIDKLVKAGLFHHIVGNSNELFVVSQSIASNTSVPEGSIIGLELKSNVDTIGGDANNSILMVAVPSLVNMDEKAAKDLLLEKGFMVSIQAPTALDDSLDHYYIISQSIDAGTEVPVGTHITLEKGAVKVGAQVTVPNLIGMEQSEATALLINRGLSFQVSVKASEANSSMYYVINQSVSPNSQVTSGTIIRLELSSKKP